MHAMPGADTKSWGGGGGGGVLSVLGPIQKRGGGGGLQSASGPIRQVRFGGGAACRTMINILVCARARDSAWGMERGGGGAAIGPRGRHFV